MALVFLLWAVLGSVSSSKPSFSVASTLPVSLHLVQIDNQVCNYPIRPSLVFSTHLHFKTVRIADEQTARVFTHGQPTTL